MVQGRRHSRLAAYGLEHYVILPGRQKVWEQSNIPQPIDTNETTDPGKKLLATTTNHDGRIDWPLIDETAIKAFIYELNFFGRLFCKTGYQNCSSRALGNIFTKAT